MEVDLFADLLTPCYFVRLRSKVRIDLRFFQLKLFVQGKPCGHQPQSCREHHDTVTLQLHRYNHHQAALSQLSSSLNLLIIQTRARYHLAAPIVSIRHWLLAIAKSPLNGQ